MVSFHHVSQVSRLSAAKIITKIPVGVEGVAGMTYIPSGNSLRVAKWLCSRIGVPRFVMVEGEAIQNHYRILGNEQAPVDEVFSGIMRGRQPERGM